MAGVAARERAERVGALPLEYTGQAHGFFTGTMKSVAEIWRHRELLGLLVRRELKARYKDSSLGVLWSLVRPLAQLLIYYFAIGQVLGVARSIPSFAIFVFVGLTAWTLFSEIVAGGTTSIVDNAGLVKKVYLPREIFPLASLGGALFNFLMQLIILVLAMIVLGQFPLTLGVLYAPLGLMVIIVFATASALMLGALNVYFRDIQHLVEVVLIVLFWTSPIVYSYSYVNQFMQGSWLEQVYLANPITVGILGMQRGLWVAGSADPSITNWPPDLAVRLWVALAVGAVFLWFSQRVFSRLQGNFAQEL